MQIETFTIEKLNWKIKGKYELLLFPSLIT